MNKFVEKLMKKISTFGIGLWKKEEIVEEWESDIEDWDALYQDDDKVKFITDLTLSCFDFTHKTSEDLDKKYLFYAIVIICL